MLLQSDVHAWCQTEKKSCFSDVIVMASLDLQNLLLSSAFIVKASLDFHKLCCFLLVLPWQVYICIKLCCLLLLYSRQIFIWKNLSGSPRNKLWLFHFNEITEKKTMILSWPLSRSFYLLWRQKGYLHPSPLIVGILFPLISLISCWFDWFCLLTCLISVVPQTG